MTSTTPAAALDGRPAATAVTAETVQWLTAEQQVLWRSFLVGTQRLADVLAHELEAQSGLSSHEYEVLVRLSESPGRTLRMAQLADHLAHSRSRLTHTIRRMEQSGLVVRAACTEDARGVNCTMTDHGWDVLVAAAPGHVQSVRDHLVDILTDEQFRALGEAMDAVRVHLTGGPCHAE
ncbi:MarR family transcriptional regulator [Cellulomonas chitinilytica]|uniref:MarR family transcriptional regulator n=1 Tax=Cellulomonas chitinilytica TaxID=398759 RepID=A0A919U3I9_9CELL|nr:MarR family winged helix-turn-helix transcriptional regulator [Cellulomonas chitinilytica]GIG22194.1 MarR family transcriptional regulator [Cellulomonas chitinilytica]